MHKRSGFKLNWKYALGEVFLIFIGISLAIGFQNWNEDRKKKTDRRIYYANLLEDLKRDNDELARLGEIVLRELKTRSKADSVLKTDLSSNKKVEELMNLYYQAGLFEFFPNTDTYDDLVASGNIKILKDNIRSELVRLANLHTKYRRYEQGNNDFLLSISKSMHEKVPLQRMDAHWKTFLKTDFTDVRISLFNFFKSSSVIMEQTQIRYAELININSRLIALLNQELAD
ncbi:MAG: hypothetical protein HEP71_03460 [Roseivirga sp.]|nr:hypothetical protein [Roseivirga sp.]